MEYVAEQAVRITEAWCHLTRAATILEGSTGFESCILALQCVLEWFKSSSISWDTLLAVDALLREIFEVQLEFLTTQEFHRDSFARLNAGELSDSDKATQERRMEGRLEDAKVATRKRLSELLGEMRKATDDSEDDPVFNIGNWEVFGLQPPNGGPSMTVSGLVTAIDAAAVGALLKSFAAAGSSINMQEIKSIVTGSLHRKAAALLNL